MGLYRICQSVHASEHFSCLKWGKKVHMIYEMPRPYEYVGYQWAEIYAVEGIAVRTDGHFIRDHLYFRLKTNTYAKSMVFMGENTQYQWSDHRDVSSPIQDSISSTALNTQMHKCKIFIFYMYNCANMDIAIRHWYAI